MKDDWGPAISRTSLVVGAMRSAIVCQQEHVR
jgi:hypothetical protein